jgi:hypothetical protein
VLSLVVNRKEDFMHPVICLLALFAAGQAQPNPGAGLIVLAVLALVAVWMLIQLRGRRQEPDTSALGPMIQFLLIMLTVIVIVLASLATGRG